MKTPQEFIKFCEVLLQNMKSASSLGDEQIFLAFNSLDETQNRIVKQFLNDLVVGQATETEIQQAWSDALPEYRISGSENSYRDFITKVRDIIEKRT
jgi:hypothetical protein